MTVTITVVLATVLLALAAWIRAAGTAVTRVPRADALRDASDEVRGAERVAELLDERESITPAVGVVVSGLLVSSAVLATVALSFGLEFGAAIIAGLLVGAVIFIFGDPLPRSLGRWNPHPIAYRSAALLTLATTVGGWANELLTDDEEIEETDEESQEQEDVEEQERELIDSVLEFSETVVREVMTPRPDMVTIAADAGMDELISVATEEGYSRIPVSSNGDIVGIVVVKDLLATLGDAEQRPDSVADVMRPVEFVPETKYASSLLNEMRERHQHQVMVVDEYGDIVGLVTIEDLIEELVGEISDETDLVENLIVPRADGWEVDARTPVDELEKVVGVDLPDEEWDTVGGLVLGLAERVPEVGEIFRLDNVAFRVERMQGRRVSVVGVTVEPPVGVT